MELVLANNRRPDCGDCRGSTAPRATKFDPPSSGFYLEFETFF
jgi:hypothetical protein